MFQTVFPGSPVATDKVCTNAVPSNYWRLPDDRADCAPFDVAAANKALDDAGYTRGADGIRVDPKSKTPLVFEHCTSNTGFRQLGGDFLAKSMEAIGIKLNLNFVDSTTVLFANWPDVSADTKCNTYHGTYDTAEFGYSLTFDLFGNYYYGYHSEQIPTDANKGNGYNTVRFNDPGDGRGAQRPQGGAQAGRPGPGRLQGPGAVHQGQRRDRPVLPERGPRLRDARSRTCSGTRPRRPSCGTSRTGTWPRDLTPPGASIIPRRRAAEPHLRTRRAPVRRRRSLPERRRRSPSPAGRTIDR